LKQHQRKAAAAAEDLHGDSNAFAAAVPMKNQPTSGSNCLKISSGPQGQA
jgi:hypothetical protein